MCNANRYARGARLHNRRNCESDGVVPGGGVSRGWKKRRTKRTKHETMEEDERARAVVAAVAVAAAAEVARSGDLYQSQRTPVTMATKLDFFFEVFSALLAGAHSPETGGSERNDGSTVTEDFDRRLTVLKIQIFFAESACGPDRKRPEVAVGIVENAQPIPRHLL
ncbi:hypothetical protein ALC56_10912 [Trachymyrmex septentrionalis]|uniref:Uncharacterized protein n=1 Tax=Trachymyrmex septentrionalis TaxID=34720 RepID=A0A195F4D3_9HYME|nr:hypothetical protein ALC56_10912 [Trachymyrmex septentrionalis]